MFTGFNGPTKAKKNMPTTESETQRGRFHFRVTVYADGTPWIMTDPLHAGDRLNILGDAGFIGFDLRAGTTGQEAEQVARFLNEHVEYITCTLFAA
jgi:hypothetical protein